MQIDLSVYLTAYWKRKGSLASMYPYYSEF